MAGIPNRGMAGTYPAPPFDPLASGLTGPRPFKPVPCNIEIFSSSVICFTTSDARSSADKVVFIQGRLVSFWPVAKDESRRRIASKKEKDRQYRNTLANAGASRSLHL